MRASLLVALGLSVVPACDCGDDGNEGEGEGGEGEGEEGEGEGEEGEGEGEGEGEDVGQDGPADADVELHPQDFSGDDVAGQAVFRFETFGNENFWTDAVQVPQGIVAAGLTPVQALGVGLSVNSAAVVAGFPPATVDAIIAELATDLSPAQAPILNDPATTIALINANAVIGVVAVDSNNNGTIDVAAGDKVGVSCALCHAITDGALLANPLGGGTIGAEIDGPTPHNLNVGAIFATAANTRALYPIAQVRFDESLAGATTGRKPGFPGLTQDSTEAEFDAYFSDPVAYPIGMFDDQPDGTGAPMHITPMIRQDLAAPYGSEGAISRLDNFSNLVFTALFDLRNLNSVGGRAFMQALAGPAGLEIVDDYVEILTETGVPTAGALELAVTDGTPGAEETPIGLRVDNDDLLDLSAYFATLTAINDEPAGDATAIANGRSAFRVSCTSCHNVDQSLFVPQALVPMGEIFPGDDPVLVVDRSAPPFKPGLNDAVNTVDNIFDDKMIIVNASLRGDVRGVALPLLTDLARKPVFLHDDSVDSLETLLDPARGADSPHPFYVDDAADRDDMIEFLESLDTDP